MAGAAIAAMTEEIEIGLEYLRPSPFNPRKSLDPVKLAELVESVAQVGFLVKPLVRPMYDSEDGDIRHYEFVAGHRRFAVAQALKHPTMRCDVREMSDDEAREIALIDNLQREDVPPLEEAEAFGELLKQLLTVPAVAAKVGKEQSYVAKRLKLLGLTVWSRDALREKLITIDHAALLARLAEAEQNEALKWCLDPQAGKKTPVQDVVKDRLKRKNPPAAEAISAVDIDSEGDSDGADDEADYATYQTGRRAMWNRAWECESVQRLKEHIECSSGEVLDRAPWPMEEDWLLLDVGSCLDCPKNTKANTPLFGDLDMGVAVCTDGACFKAKVESFVVLQSRDEAKRAANLAGKPPVLGAVEPVRVSWKSTGVAPRMLKPGICMCKSQAKCSHGEGPDLRQVFKDGQWVEASKTCEHTLVALSVDWSDANNRGYGGTSAKLRKPGEILHVCVASGCKVHPKAYEKKVSGSSSGQSQAQRDEQERKRKEAVNLENQLRLGQAVVAMQKVGSLPWQALRAMLLSMAASHRVDVHAIKSHLYPGFDVALETAAVDSPAFAKAVAVLSISLNGLGIAEWQRPDAERDSFLKALKRLGHDGSKAWSQPKVADKPAPKKAAAKKAVPAKKAAKVKAAKATPGKPKPTKPPVKKAAKPVAKKAAVKKVRK